MDKNKTPTILFIFLVFLTWLASGERNDCCSDKGPIIKKRCSNGERSWVKICTDGAYILLEDQYVLSEDDTITTNYSGIIIKKESYCLGSIENKTEIIAIICFSKTAASSEENNPYLYAVQICCVISIACLAMTTLIYILLPKLRDLQGKCIMITIFNLMIAYIVLFVLQRKDNNFQYAVCIFLAASMYFWFLSAFFWMNIVAINIWRTTIRPQCLANNKYIFVYYNMYGWGCPFIFLLVAFISHHTPGNHIKPGWTEYSCWFTEIPQLIYFHIPILILMSVNIIIFISVGWKIWKYEKYNLAGGQPTNIRIHKSLKYKCILYIKLFLVMGLSWIFEPMSMILYKEGFYLWLVTDYINALQGVIIFLLLVVFRKRVRRDLARRGGILCGRLPKEWALIPDEELEELEEDMDRIEAINDDNVQLNHPF